MNLATIYADGSSGEFELEYAQFSTEVGVKESCESHGVRGAQCGAGSRQCDTVFP